MEKLVSPMPSRSTVFRRRTANPCRAKKGLAVILASVKTRLPPRPRALSSTAA